MGSTAEGAGGGTGTVDTDGSARCTGRSPTTTCTTTPCGAITTTTRSGVTATTTSMSACSRPTPTTTSLATCRNTPAPPQGTTGAAPPASATPGAAASQLAQMCGEDSHDIAGLPIDQFQQAIQPTAAQQAALDDLANASLKAAQDIKAACPTDIALTAPSRLAAMQQRIEAMIAAVATVQPALEKFYSLLSDEQKARLTALGNDQRQNQAAEKTTARSTKRCGTAQPGVMEWPTAEIDQAVRPTEAQRASLAALQNATTKAADMLKAACLTDNPITPPARLAAVGKRLDTMLQAIKTVRSALNDFYGSLSDEQKARFEAIGPQRTSQLESLDVVHTTVRRHGVVNVGQVIRRLMSIAR